MPPGCSVPSPLNALEYRPPFKFFDENLPDIKLGSVFVFTWMDALVDK